MLIHVEVQTTPDVEFPLRMYVYHYRIFDRYNMPLASLAVLADDDPNWQPKEFHESLFGCEAILRFPTVKLLEFAPRESELEASTNPFAKVVLAHLKTRQTKGDPSSRHVWKLRLVRGLFEQGFNAKDVRTLFRVIDWLMALPPPLDAIFRQDVENFQKEKKMPYVTSIERVARREGLRKGIAACLKMRFGAEGLKLMAEIEEIHDGDLLEMILQAIEAASHPEEIRRLWNPPAP